MRNTLRNAAFVFALTASLMISTPAFAVAYGGAPRPGSSSALMIAVNTVLSLFM